MHDKRSCFQGKLLFNLLQVNGKQGQKITQSLYRFGNRNRNCDPVVMAYGKAAMIVFSNRTIQHNIPGRKIKISAIADFPLNAALPAMMNRDVVGIIKAPRRATCHMEVIIYNSNSGIHLIVGCCSVSCFIFHLVDRAGFIPAEQLHILL